MSGTAPHIPRGRRCEEVDVSEWFGDRLMNLCVIDGDISKQIRL